MSLPALLSPEGMNGGCDLDPYTAEREFGARCTCGVDAFNAAIDAKVSEVKARLGL